MRAIVLMMLELGAATAAQAGTVSITPLAVGDAAYQFGQAINDAGDVLVGKGPGEVAGYVIVRPSTGERHVVPLPPDADGAEFLNDADQVVGQGFDQASQRRYTLIWDRGAVTKLFAPGCDDTTPAGLNNAGEVLLGCLEPNLDRRAYLYQGGTYTPIVYPGANLTDGYGLNASGQVVGQYFLQAGGSGFFVWQAGDFSPLALPAESLPVAINDAGSVLALTAFNRHHGEIHYHAEVLTPQGLRRIVVPGAISVLATGLSADGQVALNAEMPDQVTYVPYVWRDGVLTAFPPPPPRDGLYLSGINASGEILGTGEPTRFAANGARAFVATCSGAGC